MYEQTSQCLDPDARLANRCSQKWAHKVLIGKIDCTVYPKKYAHGFCFAVLCCGYILTDFPISIRLTSLALWQSNDCPSASKATLMNMDKYFMWIHYERLHNHNKAKHNKTVCIFLGIYCSNVMAGCRPNQCQLRSMAQYGITITLCVTLWAFQTYLNFTSGFVVIHQLHCLMHIASKGNQPLSRYIQSYNSTYHSTFRWKIHILISRSPFI